MSLLICNHLTLGYNNNVVMEDLNFVVNAQDYLCILGENGSGKSTLMKTLLKLQRPISGEIINTAKGIGYLPQQTNIQRDFPASVEEVVLSGCLNHKRFASFYTKEEKKRVWENMDKVGITHLSNYCYRELSGGQQQRVLLARALCATNDLLLLDEPVAGLDPTSTNNMYQIIRELNESGIAIIMISHDINNALNDATHILRLGSNKMIFYGSKEDYLNSTVNNISNLSAEMEENKND